MRDDGKDRAVDDKNGAVDGVGGESDGFLATFMNNRKTNDSDEEITAAIVRTHTHTYTNMCTHTHTLLADC